MCELQTATYIPKVYTLTLILLFDSYVLLHHVMGELDGMKGAWAYVEGGMGAVSEAIANCARSFGTDIFTNKVSVALISNILLC